MIALSQYCLPRDPEKVSQCFSVFKVSVMSLICFTGEKNLILYHRHANESVFTG